MKKSLKADLMLVLVTFFWGTTYVFTKMAVESLPPLNLVSWRFGIAFAVMLPIFWKRIKNAGRQTVLYSALLAFPLLLCFVAMTYGVKYTSASNASFLAGISIIFIALGAFLFHGKKPDKKTIFCILLTLAGIALLTLGPDFRIHMGIGDLLSLSVSLFYGIYVLLLDRYARRVDPVSLGVMQLGFVAGFSVILSGLFERSVCPTGLRSWVILLILGIFCTAIAYVMQTVAQKYTTPTHTGIILSLEIVFSGIFAYLLLGEVLRPINYIGAFLLISAVLIMEIDFGRMKP